MSSRIRPFYLPVRAGNHAAVNAEQDKYTIRSVWLTRSYSLKIFCKYVQVVKSSVGPVDVKSITNNVHDPENRKVFF